MKKTYLLLFTLLLVNLIHADTDLLCNYLVNPHQGSDLLIRCQTKFSQSLCIANVSDENGNFMTQYPEYPSNILQDLKEPYHTFNDGSFMVSIFIDDKKYSVDTNYTTTINCVDPSDNSTNSTTFIFSPVTYNSFFGLSADEAVNILVWLRGQIYILIFFFIAIIIIIALVITCLRIAQIPPFG